jgi:phage-related protein (TIGR01555 family)
VNTQNRFGIETDPNFNTFYLPRLEMQYRELADLYSNPLVKRIVSLHAGDGTRKGFKLIHESDAQQAGDIKQELERRFHATSVLSKMIAIRHLFGGGLVYVDLDDGRTPDMPLNTGGVRRIYSFQPVEAQFAQVVTDRPLLQDEKPGQPMHYRIHLTSTSRAESFVVHESRCIRFPSFESDDVISQRDRVKRRTWPESTIQILYDSLKRYGVSIQSFSSLLQSFVEEVFKVSNLNDFHDLESLRNYVREQRLMRNSLNATVISADDDLSKLAMPVTGMNTLHDEIARDVSMSTGIPLSILFSNESGALGGTTISGDRLSWYDIVRSAQQNQYSHFISEVLRFYSLEAGFDCDDYRIEWNPLHELTEKEVAEVREIHARTMATWAGIGLPTSNAIDSTFGGEEWNTNSVNYEPGEVEALADEMDAAEYEDKEDAHQKQIELIEAKAKASKKAPEGQTSFLDEKK